MTSLDSTRHDIAPTYADTDGDADTGAVDYGHFHVCPDMLVETAGTRLLDPARLNPMFRYWIGQDAAGRWALASSLGGWNVVGYVELIVGADLVPDTAYVIEHDEPFDGPCSMVVRQASLDELPG